MALQWPDDLLREHGFVVSSGSLRVRGKEHVVTSGATIEAESRSPSALPSVGVMAASVFALPFTLGAHDWSVSLPISVMLLAGLRLLTADSRYHVVLRSRGRAVSLFEGEDERLVIALTAAIRAALEEAGKLEAQPRVTTSTSA
ncbi:MAG: hypothetical protein JNK82_29800 [Myxococcaceae bacterium]|nr:hypothetical protein [Myxococcaceae bacterium]